MQTVRHKYAKMIKVNFPEEDNALSPRVYYMDVRNLMDEKTFGDIYADVSAYRKQKIASYYFRKDKNLSLGVAYLLRCACADCSINYNEQTLKFGKQGKPFFAGLPLYFNLAHAGVMALCTIAQHQVGCDIEAIGTCTRESVAYCLTDAEKAAFCKCKTASEQSLFFYRLWTLKESFLKCLGVGMSLTMQTISLLVDGKITTHYTYGGNEYLFLEGNIDAVYQYAICLKLAEKNPAGLNV